MRYVLKKTKEPKRGESGYIDAWYVYDTIERRAVSATSTVKHLVQKICDTFNCMGD